jgi:rare lipoprotein A
MYEMTAAHRSLPFGTEIRVHNVRTGAEASVIVNDRGPFVEGRILDLSRAAAERLGAVRDGVVPVRIEVARLGDGMLQAPCWEVQVGAFAKEENVARARATLERSGFTVRLAPAGGGLTRVRATGLGGHAAAVGAAGEMSGAFPGAVPVPCPESHGGAR